MITFSSLGRYGRLGNQLFQIASTIGISINNGVEFSFPIWFCRYSNKNYNDFFSKKLPTKYIENYVVLKEQTFNYYEINIKDKSKNYDLFGYFQSEKYFSNHRDVILEYFDFNKDIKERVDYIYGDNLLNSCSLHIRRGDYLQLQNIHPVLTIDYYYKSINYLYGEELDNVNFFIFSDDILWCENNIKLPNTNFIKLNDEISELYLMSKCKNNIIANSSFSWWGAWLNRNEQKKIISPKNWFGSEFKDNYDDIYCDNWIKI